MPTIVLVKDQTSANTVTCQVTSIGGQKPDARYQYKPEEFKIFISKNPTFDTPQVSLGWWGRRDPMGWMKSFGKFGIGNSWDHILFKDEANNAELAVFTNAKMVAFTTSLITGSPLRFSGPCEF